jgi:DNA-binding NarL/FixJ family response regulator
MELLEMATTPALAAPVPERVMMASATMQEAPATAPDALVIDLARVVEADPLRLCRETALRSPATAIIGFGAEDRLADGYQLLRLGALTWITGTPGGSGESDEAIAATLRGESRVAPRHAAWILADFAALAGGADGPDPRFNPTATEREVLVRLAKGQTPEEIAAFHDVDPHLVARHVNLALERLHRWR